MSRNGTRVSVGPANEVGVIQQLRCIAALLKGHFRAAAQTDWLLDPLPIINFGMAGVEIFVIISVLVMFVAGDMPASVSSGKSGSSGSCRFTGSLRFCSSA